MTRGRKIIFGLVIIILMIILGGEIFLNRIRTQALPVIEGELTVSGLSKVVNVYRDEFGVPTIAAENEKDLYRAVGYVMAQDRLWQMDLLRRVTLGRLSEIFGKDMVDTDLLMRSLRMTEKSQALIASCSDQGILDAISAFSDGVNQYITELDGHFPPEFEILGYEPEPWEPYHSANLIGYMAWDLTMPYTTETILHKIRNKVGDELYSELLPDLATQTIVHKQQTHAAVSSGWDDVLVEHSDVLEKLGLEVFNGSNNWVAGPARTVTGAPLFSNDMHLGLFAPGLWYPMHQIAANGVHVTGVVLPGQPFVIAGHNESIAWGMTNVMVDDMDFYLEKTSADHPGQYEYMGEWHDFKVVNEIVHIKGGETVEKSLRFTNHGPVISQFKNMGHEVVTMQWLGNAKSNELRSVYLFNRAQNWAEFRNAAKTFVAVSQNIAYADVKGNFGLQTCAGVPIRKNSNGVDIMPGWTDEYEWSGIVPFDELPYSYNPPEGVVSSANNRTVGDDYPYYISYWFALHYRIDRIREMLSTKEKLSVQDFETMHMDHHSIMVRDILPGLISKLQSNRDKLSSSENVSLKLLEKWDGDMKAEAAAPAIFDMFYVQFFRNMLADEMGDSLYTEYTKSSYMARYFMDFVWRTQSSQWAEDVTTADREETLDDMIFKSYSGAVSALQSAMGNNPESWQWGKIHTLTLSHPMGSVSLLNKVFNLNKGPYAAPGSFHTVGPYAYKLSKPFDVNHGASHRHIYDVSNWDSSRVIIPTGASGIPASEFYCSQSDMYMKGEYRQDLFSLEKVKSAAKYHLLLEPK